MSSSFSCEVEVYRLLRLASLALLLLLSGDVETNPGPKPDTIPMSFLSELVKLPVAAKWRKLGLQLGVAHYKLDEIQCNNHNKPNFAQHCLTDMFVMWLNKNKETTFAKLAKGLYNTQELEVFDSVKETLCPAYASREHFEKNIKFSMTFKWKDIGQELGVPQNVLETFSKDKKKHSSSEVDPGQWCFLKTLEWWKENSPTAAVTLQEFTKALHGIGEHDKERELKEIHYGNVKFRSPPPGPRPELPKCIVRYSEYLREIYLAQPVLPDSDWPPSLGGQFIRLALIPRQRGVYAEKYDTVVRVQKDYVRGNVDKILAGRSDEKTETQADQIFKPLRCLAGENLSLHLLIDGAPGVGKTTLSRKFAQDWASGVLLQEYDLVVLLHLRDRAVSQATSIDEFFYHDDPDLHQSVIRHVRKTGGKRILLIFDGFDELSTSERSRGSFFMKIIEGKVLSKCSVVVTSRPYASVGLQELSSINRHIEVLGFTEDNIKQCIVKTIKDDPQKAQELCTQLHERMDIMSLCYIPLNCAIMLFVYQQEDFSLPKTLTELYKIFALHTIKRHVQNLFGDTVARRIRSLDKLPKEIEASFSVLCKLAYDSLIKDQLVFHEDDIVDSFPDIGDQDIERQTLALMTVAKSYSKRGREVTCNFLHLTIQEFLAAKWVVVNLSPTEISGLLYNNLENDRLRMMLLFVAGIVKQDFPKLDKIFSRGKLSLDTCPPNYQFLQLCHLVYESGSTTASTQLANLISGECAIELSHNQLSGFEFLVVLTFLVQSEIQWDLMKIYCKEKQFKMYREIVSDNKVRLKNVKLEFSGEDYAELLQFAEETSIISDIELHIKSGFTSPESITTLLSLIDILGQSLSVKLSFLSLVYTQVRSGKSQPDKYLSLSFSQLTDSQLSEAMLFFLNSGYHWKCLSLLKSNKSNLEYLLNRIDMLSNEESRWDTRVEEIELECEDYNFQVLSGIMKTVCEPLKARVKLTINLKSDFCVHPKYVKLFSTIARVKRSSLSLSLLSVVNETSTSGFAKQLREIEIPNLSVSHKQLSTVTNFVFKSGYSWDVVRMECDNEILQLLCEEHELNCQINKLVLDYVGWDCRVLLKLLKNFEVECLIQNTEIKITAKNHRYLVGTDCLPTMIALANITKLSCFSVTIQEAKLFSTCDLDSCACRNIILYIHDNTYVMEEMHVMFHIKHCDSLKSLLTRNTTLLVLEIFVISSDDVLLPVDEQVETLLKDLEKPLSTNKTLTNFTIMWKSGSILFERDSLTSKLIFVQSIDKYRTAGETAVTIPAISIPSSLQQAASDPLTEASPSQQTWWSYCSIL